MTKAQQKRLRAFHSRADMLEEIRVAAEIRGCLELDLDFWYRLPKRYREAARMQRYGDYSYLTKKQRRELLDDY